MFSSNGRNPFACQGVGCVKLPATAAFPTDDKLLQRIEEARRALPRDSVKALRRAPQAENTDLVSELLTPSAEQDAQARANALRAAIQRAARAELAPTSLRIEALSLRGRAAAG
jgi:hypothetical protein